MNTFAKLGGNTSRSRYIWFVALMIFACSSKSEWPIPSELSERGWRAMVLYNAYHEYGFGHKPQESMLNFPRRLDWFVTLGNRFAGVYSLRDSASVDYWLWIGEHNGGEVYIPTLAEDGEYIRKKEMSVQEYLKALESDSLWTLFGKKHFWKSSGSWESYINARKYTRIGNSDYALGVYYRPDFLVPPRFRSPRLADWEIFSGHLGLAMAFAYDKSFEQYVSDQRTLTMLNYSVLKGSYFATIVCRRNESNGAYAIAIGQLEGHLMTYRLLGNRIHPIQDRELEDYIDLLVNDKIRSLIGPEEFWKSEESMNLLYDSYFNDSPTTGQQTRTLHLDSLFEPGYLNRSVQ